MLTFVKIYNLSILAKHCIKIKNNLVNLCKRNKNKPLHSSDIEYENYIMFDVFTI